MSFDLSWDLCTKGFIGPWSIQLNQEKKSFIALQLK